MANITEIAKLVLERTKEGRLAWEATADENSYLATLGNQSVRISRSSLPGSVYYVFSVLNKDGREIETLSTTPSNIWINSVLELGSATPLGTINDFLPMIFQLALRRAMDVDKELEELAKILSAR